MDSVTDPPCGGGCPIRKSSDQSLLAAPRGLSQRATSFIASRRQGIHQMPFSHSPRPSGKSRCQRTEIRGQMSERHRTCDRCHRQPPTNRGKTSIPMLGTAIRPPKREGRATAPMPVSRPPGDKPRAAGCTSPPYDVTCKRKVAATAATEGLIHRRQMSPSSILHRTRSSASPQGQGPRGKQRPGLVGPGRLERPTSRLSGVRSNQLSYGPRSETRGQRAEIRKLHF